MNDRKLLLIDAYALIYRAYYALIRAPRITSRGMNTSAIFGFVNALDEVLRRQSPSHVAVCFDPAGPTFRHDMYPAYKANRDKQPEDITRSVPYIKDIVRAYGIPVVEAPGYEADDVIGTLSRRAEREGFLTYMMTPDKDYGQLVTERVLMYKPSTRGAEPEVRGPRQVCQRYSIASPAQVVDLLALEGDAADNIPGCPGVGEKTAIKLIAEYGSVDALLDRVDEVGGALQKRIAANAELIRFSKQLVTIRTDVPVGVSIDELRLGTADVAALTRIYTELEFRTFLQRLPAAQPSAQPASQPSAQPASQPSAPPSALPSIQPAAQQPAPAGCVCPCPGLQPGPQASPASQAPQPLQPQPVEGTMGSLFDEPAPAPAAPAAPTRYDAEAARYLTLTTPAEVRDYVAALAASGVAALGVASYAVGESDMTASWYGTAIADAPGHAAYVEMPAEADARRAMAQAMAPLFEGEALVVSHDVKRQMTLLRREGVGFSAPYFDTSIAHYLLEPEMNHSLARVAAAVLAYYTLDYDDDARLGRRGATLPLGDEAKRTCEQADVALRLHRPLAAKVADAGQGALMADVELPLVAVLADMQWAGVRIDVAALAELQRRFAAQLRDMEAEAYRLAGTPFNIASPQQVGEVLFGRLALDPKAKRTKKGGYSTTEDILDKYRDAHPLVGLIIDIRGLRKLLTTYVEALPALVNPATGKIHTTFNQTVTATGRISSANPNLQNIPVRSADGREIRRAFIADPGCMLLSADYSQIELRVIADLSGDEEMIGAFASGADIHASTAAKIYHVGLADVTGEQRTRAKTANFGIIYGISAFGLAQRLHIPRAEAKELIEGYFRTYPRVRQYIDGAVERARQQGYVTTIMGRKRFLPDINSRNAVVRSYAERNAVNAPIQGSAADIIKVAMVNVARHLRERGLRSRMLIQVHDELVFNVVPEEVDVVRQIVAADMAAAHCGRVALLVSTGVAANWLEAH